jgi:hypothetical protein
MDRFSKACLVLVVLLLAVIALRPSSPDVHAAIHKQYLWVRTGELSPFDAPRDAKALTTFVNKYSADGWETQSAFQENGFYTFIFEK